LRVSVIIGTKDRPESLRRCLESLAAQRCRPLEVLLLDDGTPGAESLGGILEEAGIRWRYIRKDEPGLSRSRNLGAREAAGEVLLFLDDDVELDPGYLEAVLRVYREHPGVAGVGGRLEGIRYGAFVKGFLRFFALDSGRREGEILKSGIGVLIRRITADKPVEWLSGCNMSFRRELFEEFHFDEGFGPNGWGDDMDFSYRVSRRYPLMAAHGARLLHRVDPAGRADAQSLGRMESYYPYRFFRKNMPKRLINWVAFGWSALGILLKNLLRRDPNRILGNLGGIWAILSESFKRWPVTDSGGLSLIRKKERDGKDPT
jgi:GT2 family glycosyltransferase